MNHRYYVLFIEGDIEPQAIGPFDHAWQSDLQALALKKEHGDEHGIYYMDVDSESGEVEVNAFSSGFMEVEDNDYVLYIEESGCAAIQHFEKNTPDLEVAEWLRENVGPNIASWEWVKEFPEAQA